MMWRFFFIATLIGHGMADSSSNADANSRSKFPVQVEADSGAPKAGEGEGGVAVLLKPMPEATTMKTWSFLKESMLKIGDQVRQIMQVRNDIAMLQQDLTMQEKLWHQAEITLNQENAKLRGQKEDLQKKAKAGAKVKRDLMKAKQSLEEEQRRTVSLDNEAAMQEKKWQIEVRSLDARKNNVTALHREVNESASREIARAEAVHLQLQKDAATLRLALDNFQDRYKTGQEKMDFENSKSKAQQAELMRQIAAMKAGLERIKGKLKPRHIYDNEEVMLKQKLQQETDTILHIQSEHQQIVTECTKELQEQDQIKCAEGEKLRVRIQEKTQFCNAIQVQNEVLRQDLAKCGVLFGVGPRPVEAPASAPALAPAVPVRDEERLIMAAPAPSLIAPAPAPGGFPVL